MPPPPQVTRKPSDIGYLVQSGVSKAGKSNGALVSRANGFPEVGMSLFVNIGSQMGTFYARIVPPGLIHVASDQ